VQANKAVVGVNAFAHEAGIHQDGFIKERTTYEIMMPADVGWEASRIVLGRHSGRHGVAYRLQQLGFTFDPDVLDAIYARFLHLAEREREVTDPMLRDLVADITRRPGGTEQPAYVQSSAL
jgi:2-isopropylmalate synthase